jgi:hypothetical protein
MLHNAPALLAQVAERIVREIRNMCWSRANPKTTLEEPLGFDDRPIPEASDSVLQLRERRYQCSLGSSGQWVCRRSNL